MERERGLRDRTFALLFVGLIAAFVAYLLVLVPPRAFVAASFAACPLVQLGSRPRRSEWYATAALGAALALGYTWLHELSASDWFAVVVIGIGSGSIIVVAVKLLSTRAAERPQVVRRVAAVSAMPVLLIFGILGLLVVDSTTPLTFDATLTAVDRTLGMDPSFALGRAFASDPRVGWLGQRAYDALAVGIGAVCAAVWRRHGQHRAERMLLALLYACVIAGVCYAILPAAGPVFQWGSRFPFDPPSDPLPLGAGALAHNGFRNAIPSVHMAAAEVVVIASLSLIVPWQFVGALAALSTVAATLGTGQHYLVDLVAAAPLTAASMAIATGGRRHWKIATINLIGLAAWIAVLRWMPELLLSRPTLTWVVVAVLVALSWASCARVAELRDAVAIAAAEARA
jgi:hypothetical protein